MAKITVHYDKGTDTLVVWWGDKHREFICEETDSDVIVMLDEDRNPIGIEVLEYYPADGPIQIGFSETDTSVDRPVRASA